MSDCKFCPVEKDCGYEFKPTDCVQQRKFKQSAIKETGNPFKLTHGAINHIEISDFEINKEVAKELGYLVKEYFEFGQLGFTEKYHAQYPNTIWAARTNENGEQCEVWEQINFCEAPEDAWPIITENKIAVMPDSDNTWKAGCLPSSPYAVGWAYFVRGQIKPLRAAMIAFLNMRKNQKGEIVI